MSSAQDHYRNGDLGAAVSALSEELRAAPGHVGKRAFLTELLCALGDFERADRQLEAMLALDPDTLLTVATWRQLLRAAQARREVFSAGRAPEVADTPTDRIKTLLTINLAIREGRLAEAAAAAQALEAARRPCPAVVDGQQVEDVRDLDDLCAGILEVLASNGKYFWVDLEQVASLRLEPPRRPLDLLWRKARLVLRNGSDSEVFIPAIYPTVTDDPAALLGRRTDWLDDGGLVRGTGLRTWLIGDHARPLTELDSIEFTA